MTDVPVTYRRRAFAIARAVRERTGRVDTFALAWTDTTHVVARQRVGRRHLYRSFPMDGDDDRVADAIVAWLAHPNAAI